MFISGDVTTDVLTDVSSIAGGVAGEITVAVGIACRITVNIGTGLWGGLSGTGTAGSSSFTRSVNQFAGLGITSMFLSRGIAQSAIRSCTVCDIGHKSPYVNVVVGTVATEVVDTGSGVTQGLKHVDNADRMC